VADAPDTSPVATFCADLRRRWRASGRDLPGLAREVRISRAQLYAILNGEIKRPPDFDALVRPLIQACGGTEAEVADWRRRHEVLLGVHTELARRPARSPSPPPVQLPAEVDGFAGRAAELATLDASANPIVLITGMAGIGKTALALRWGHAATFPDGKLYADLRGFGPGEPVAPAAAIRDLLDGLGVDPARIPDSLDAQAALFRSRTAGRRLLLVLDNARDAGQVRPLLPAGPGVRTVVTSRDRLTDLVADAGAEPLVLGLPSAGEAVEMLARRSGRPADADTGALAEVCGRLPLALGLVAARMRQTGFGAAAVLAELRRPGSSTLDRLDDVFAWSYRTLGPAAARLFRLLGLTAAAEIGADAVTALAGLPPAEVTRTLRELTEAGLLDEPAPGRYRTPGLLRTYARGLGRDDDAALGLRRLLDHYTWTAYQADRVLNPARARLPRPPAGLAGPKERLDLKAAREWLGTERAVLLATLRQAKDEGYDRHAWQLGWALDTFLFEHKHWPDEGAAWAVALRAATDLVDRPAAAQAHRFLGAVAGRLKRFDEAYEHMRRASELSAAERDRPGEAETAFVLSYVRWLQGDNDAALAEAQRSWDLYAELGDWLWTGKAAIAVGWYHAVAGDPAAALVWYDRALEALAAAGDRPNALVALANRGRARHELGHYEQAMDDFLLGLRRARADGDPVLEAQCAAWLADTYDAVGDGEAARERRREAYALLAEAGHPQAPDLARKLDGG
jgi:tetratricopeptide (TPR) repeat protein